MKIVNKGVISNKENYLRLLDRLHDMYLDLKTDDIIRVSLVLGTWSLCC